MDKLERAVGFALVAHRGQKRDSGEPYVFHLFRVAQTVLDRYYGGLSMTREDCAVIAVLHDVIEDTDISPAELMREFGHDIVFYITLLSRLEVRGQKMPYLDFINEIARFEVGRLIKNADIDDNLRDVDSLPEEKRGIKNRYLKAKDILSAK